jgi:sugar phosphate isomerase/epimerase
MERFGVSTLWMPGLSLEAAIQHSRDAGFGVFELISADWQAVVGAPPVVSPGVWPRTTGDAQRAALKEKLSGFRHVVVHAHHIDLNIASVNPGIREESQRQYFEALDLAHDIGAHVATFHPGYASQSITERKTVVRYNIDFALRLAEKAHAYSIRVGLENVGHVPGARLGGLSFEELSEVIQTVDSELFGIHLDIGWVLRAAGPAAPPGLALQEVERYFKQFEGRIVALHLHGVLVTSPFGWVHHQTLRNGNALDPVALRRLIQEYYPEGPVVFEPMAPNGRISIEESVRDFEYLASAPG